MNMKNNNCYQSIKNKMINEPKGTVFALSDFSSLGSSTAIRAAMSRLTKEGYCRRIMPGIFYCPKYSAILKKEMGPVSHDVAQALARNYEWTILPSPIHAQNELGISTQVPAQVEYTSTGPTRKYKIGNIPLHFKQSRSKYLQKMSYSSALVTNALQGLKDTELDDTVLTTVAARLTAEERKTLRNELIFAPIWMQSSLLQIAEN